VGACKGLGLACRRVDKGNKMFFLADFVKGEQGQGAGAGSGTGAGAGGGGGNKQQRHQPQQHRQQKGKGKGQGKSEGQGGVAGPVSFQAKPCIYKRR
jgi:hypothetical protein